MNLIIEAPQAARYHYELENVCRLFLPMEKIRVSCATDAVEQNDGLTVRACHIPAENRILLRADVSLESFHESQMRELDASLSSDWDECELCLAEMVYELLAKLFGFTHNWGIVTGVRPIKLLRRLIAERGEDEAIHWFRQRLFVSEEKAALCLKTLKAENRLLELSGQDSFSLYVSVPFCPTRCDYCSFVSQTVERAARLIPAYVDCLAEELAYTGRLAAELGLRLETVYFGGGTPTTLEADQLQTLLTAVERSFDLSHVREYTVEAGRPDTVTADKLRVLKTAGVTRISINPQTLRDEVLQKIGRRHTVSQFYEAFRLARKCGFDNINTDLIAGLPGDDKMGFCGSLDGIISLSPESITVHTLSMKRASNLVLQRRADYVRRDDAVHMIEYTCHQLPQAGYQPYYLYRQSRAAGNQENIGWAKPGREGLYNVYIMDETHTILACGAGAVSKLKQPGGEYIERIFNYKYPYEYNRGLPEMLARKQKVVEFYEKNVSQATAPTRTDQ